MTCLAVLASFYVRFDAAGLEARWPVLAVFLPLFALYASLVYSFFSLYRAKWRFASLPDLSSIFRAVTVLALSLLVLDYILASSTFYNEFFFGKITIALYWVFQIFLLGGPRIAYRYYRYARTRHGASVDNATRALVLGRAHDAEVVVRAFESGALKKLMPIAILSPNASDHDQSLRAVPVLGGFDLLEATVAEYEARGLRIGRLIVTPSALAPESAPDTLLARARKLGLPISRMQTLEEGGTVRLAPIEVEDLLLRPTVAIDYRRLEAAVGGRRVLVTGGGGSIGAEICERALAHRASHLMVVENAEPALHAVLEKLGALDPETRVEGRIGDVRERSRMDRLMAEFKPDLVFHAAALKHVPYLEADWIEGVKTNILGSVNVAEAAVAAGARAMVMISTDKAIEPVSVLGATKRFAEMYCQALDAELASGPTRLIAVRFGNVLGSNGSVVPKFKAQIAARRPGDGHPPGHGALLHDHPGGVQSGGDRGKPRAGPARLARPGPHLRLCAEHGPAGEDPRSGRAHGPPVRARTRARHRDRRHRRAARRAAERDPVRPRGADRRHRHPRRGGGPAGVSAAGRDAAAGGRDRGGGGGGGSRPAVRGDPPGGDGFRARLARAKARRHGQATRRVRRAGAGRRDETAALTRLCRFDFFVIFGSARAENSLPQTGSSATGMRSSG